MAAADKPERKKKLKSGVEMLKRRDVEFMTDAYEIRKKDARDQFAQVIEKAGDDRPFIVTNHGKPEAAIIGVSSYRVLDYLEAMGWSEELENAAAANVTKEEFRAKLLALCEVQAE